MRHITIPKILAEKYILHIVCINMEQRNEFGQSVRNNTNNPHLAQLVVDGEELSPWGTPQKIVPQEEEQHLAFTGDARPITSNQGRRVQLVDGPSGKRQPGGDQQVLQQAGTQRGSVMQAGAEGGSVMQDELGKVDQVPEAQHPEQKHGEDQAPPM